jgi:5-hydroxyisourate hydrolase-like protein (transthyretin family)
MKKITILFVSVLVSSLTFARTGEEGTKSASGFAVVKKDDSSYKLIYKPAKTSDVTITILNNNKEVMFKETIKNSDGFLRPYNLESLPAGQYTFKIESGSISQSEVIDLRGHLNSDALKMASIIKIEEGRYMLALAGKGEEQIGIRILNDKGETLYDQNEMIKGAFARVYNLVNLSGSISFEITDSKGEVKKFVK